MSSTLSDVFRLHPIHIPLPSLPNLKSLPDSYTWTAKDDLLFSASASSDSHESLPLIDLSDPHATTLVGNACTTWGAFQLTNHGVPSRLLDDIELLTGSLFRLPFHRKIKAARSENGVSGYGVARIASFFSKKMWSEGFTVVGSPLHDFRKLWPSHHLEYCEIIEEYERHMQKLAAKLMWLALGSLGVEENDINWAGPNSDFQGTQAAIQLNHYPICPEPDRSMGLAAHTDSTLLTILYQNNTAGLQVFRDGMGWFTVPTVPDSLVVNVGDLLHILTNGIFPSVLHRARVNHIRSRFSMAYLWGPPSDLMISPLSRLVDPLQSPLYPSLTWKQYLATKATHFNQSLSIIRNYMSSVQIS
ncbi:PREDICTED: gibberellin 3-beta-dioxygenase 2-like [Camelina sativa]|uniref:Gibberellin 3-beta-dioxygenase 2-like n=1 Tax=Camelina sativa TaxID=90675 RepID=A0ABM0TR30_CAMSA|nr:PREDICTED: gibberellin 3-beta-dioxygenase 2-like [Camelina sativa]